MFTIKFHHYASFYRFRYDGIVDVRTASSTVVPIIAEKVESDKYRMQWRLLPGMASDFPESSLTMEEKVYKAITRFDNYYPLDPTMKSRLNVAHGHKLSHYPLKPHISLKHDWKRRTR